MYTFYKNLLISALKKIHLNKEVVCSLANNTCTPCQGGIPPLSKKKAENLLQKLRSGWLINNLGHLYKEYRFLNFISAMDFANNIAAIAEKEGHHPDIHISWGFCSCEIWTHKIKGLSESDFFLAAKIELLFEEKNEFK